MAEQPLQRARRLRNALRRGLLRRRRGLSALCAFGAVLACLRAVSPPPPETVPVPAASRDLPSGAVLAAGDLTTVELAPDAVPDGLASRRTALGRTLAAPLRRGEPVTDVRLVGPSLLEGYPGMVATPVRIPDAGAVSLLAVGDRVDVLAADPRGTEEAAAVATDVPVIALPAESSPSTTALSGALSGRLVVLATTGEEARELADASVGRFLSVIVSR